VAEVQDGTDARPWPRGIGAITLFVEDLEAAHELIEPAVVVGPDGGSRMQLTIEVSDVDAMCELAQ